MSIEQTFNNIEMSLKSLNQSLVNAIEAVNRLSELIDGSPAVDGEKKPKKVKVPFDDPASLVSYVTAFYQEMGQEKGARIQQVLEKMGHNNVTEVKASEYEEFYLALEVLRSSDEAG